MRFSTLVKIIFILMIITRTGYTAEGYSSINLNIPTDSDVSSRLLQLIATITILGLAPSILVMVTSFTQIIVVLSILRSALGLQQSPPNIVITSLALFLSLFIMMPTLQTSYDNGIKPFLANEISETEALEKASQPLHKFMLHNTGEKELGMFFDIAKIETVDNVEETPFRILIPSFMISELKKAFEIDFLIFLPFLIIDLLISSILMSMGMMMVPPVVISLPFKLIFFVLIDGWSALSGSLVKGFAG
ncbi:MAG: flagellar type III secretion system pore protein FliP [Rickettsiaceae bacterium H1]|nr:flagellar type III secretion system pore protein FliP [Rickettsiaceae bacterium H1]